MGTTFDVSIWSIRAKIGKGGKKSHIVRWVVAKRQWTKTFATQGLAVSFRSDLLSAQVKGEAFRLEDGLPVSMARESSGKSWFDFAVMYVDMKWPRAAAKSRSGNADAMATATLAMLATDKGKPADRILRKAMTGWAFNKLRRDSKRPSDVERALRWLEANTLPVSRLDDVAMLRRVLDQLAMKMDGKPAAAKTVTRKRAVVHNALEYAVEKNCSTKIDCPR